MVTELDKKWVKRHQAYQKRKALREQAVAYKGGKCVICGYNKCLSALDFHHPDPHTKDFTISDRMTSWDSIVRELGKVDLLCCRCHREVHDGLHPGYLVPDDDPRDWDFDPLPEVLEGEDEEGVLLKEEREASDPMQGVLCREAETIGGEPSVQREEERVPGRESNQSECPELDQDAVT